MEKDFRKLLSERRSDAGLTQKQLADKIHIDDSMISRFEKGRARPSPSTLQDLINALALYDIPRAELDELWEAAGYYRSRIMDAPVAHPTVEFIHQEFQNLTPEAAELLSADLRSIIEIAQEYFLAQRDSKQRKWGRANTALEGLREHLERRVQHWYLRIDEALGWCNYSMGHYAQALRYYGSALWSARQLGGHRQHAQMRRKEAQILIKQGDAHRRIGGQEDWTQARKSYKEAQHIFDKDLEDKAEVATCLRKIAGAYLFEGLPDKAEEFWTESLEICRAENDHVGVYKALQHKAWAYDMLGRWQEATKLYQEALDMVQQTVEDARSDGWELAKGLRYLGDAYRLQREYEEAEKTYKKALRALEIPETPAPGREVHANLILGMIELGLAQVHLKQPGRHAYARDRLNASMRAHLQLGEDFSIYRVLAEQGDLLLKLGRLEAAESRLQMASNKLGELGNVFYFANTLATLCDLYYKKGDFDKLFDTAEAARQADNGLIDYHLARVELFAARAHVDQGAYEPQASDAFCEATERALNFNKWSFGEVAGAVLREVDRAAQNIAPDVALQLCESCIQFWDSKLQELDPSKQELVGGWLETMREKHTQVKMFRPIDD